MKRILLYIAIVLTISISLFNGCMSEGDKIDYYISDTTLSIWSLKFNSQISQYVGNDTIVLGVDSFPNWAIKVNSYIKTSYLVRIDTIEYGVDNFEVWRTKFNTAIDSNFNTDAVFLFERMVQQPENNRKWLISNTIDSLQIKNQWDTLDVIYMFAAHSEQAALLNWKGDYSNSEAINPDFKIDTGFFGDASTSYINTNYNPFLFNNNYQQDYSGWYTYLWDNPTSASGAIIGVGDGVSNISSQLNRSLLWRNNFMNDNTSMTISGVPLNNSFGMFSIGRYSSSEYYGYSNTTVSDIINTTSTGAPNNNVFLQAFNNSGTPSSYKNVDYRFFAAGAFIDSTQDDELNQIVSSYLSGLNISLTNYQPFETTEVYYQPSGFIPYNPDLRIIAQRDSISLLTDDDSTVYISTNNGEWYVRKLTIQDADLLSAAVIFHNGKIMLSAIDHRMFVSSDFFATYTTSNIKYNNGADYAYHSPVNPVYPGDYLFSLDKRYYDINGVNICVFGNYTNVYEGASPINMYYMRESDNYIYIAYEFGQNIAFRDNGTATGGATGTLLGDVLNDSLFTRHVHSMSYIENNDAFYVCTGDGGGNILWMRGEFDDIDWNWEKIVGGDTAACRYKSTFDVIGDSLIVASDCTTGDDYGVWKVHYNDIGDTNLWVNKYDADNIVLILGTHENEVIASRLFEEKTILISNDSGNTLTETILSNSNILEYATSLGRSEDGFWVAKEKDTHTGESTRIKIK